MVEPWIAKRVYRLRRLPSTSDLDSTANLLSAVLGNYPICDIRIFSLASSLLAHENPRSKIATLSFRTLPPFLQRRSGSNADTDEWQIPADSSNSGVLILDTHFLGMTPLNEVPPTDHSFDCIAISGLASHPFGSWQPREQDKSFMWIRDDLPNHLPQTRAAIYGYDTRLLNSDSDQNIGDLAQGFIGILETCGWHSSSSRPIIILAHSLGGLVFREALARLTGSQDPGYKALRNNIKGAIFFGVPNLGMEQAHFKAIVQNNPNEALVHDVGRNSNYLRRLNEALPEGTGADKLRCYWAYETSESPTATMDANGNIDRNGPPAILVSRESATCRFIDTDRSLTFSINSTHSDMVKFTRDSHYYHTVISKLSKIMSFSRSEHHAVGRVDERNKQSRHSNARPSILTSASMPEEGSSEIQILCLDPEIEKFKLETQFTSEEEALFDRSTYATTQEFLGQVQIDQGNSGKLMYLKRLEPFLDAVKQLEDTLWLFEVMPEIPKAMCFAWGSLQIILSMTSKTPPILDSILNAYYEVGRSLPQCGTLQHVFIANAHLMQALRMMYEDTLEFQQVVIQQLKRPRWQELFAAAWRDSMEKIKHIVLNIGRTKRMIEGKASRAEAEEVQNARTAALTTFQREKAAQDAHHRRFVLQWLSPFANDLEQEKFRKIRSVCKDPGRWLLDNGQFRTWLDSQSQSKPFLWLSGMPGSGKTILASVIVDAVKDMPKAEVLFFYCKHKEEGRDSFIGVARALLVQMLGQRPYLLSLLYEKASTDSSVVLKSEAAAKDLMKLGFCSYKQLYIILDGLDECDEVERREIAAWFQAVTDDLLGTGSCSIKCLFVSQHDKISGTDFKGLPAINTHHHNQEDLKEFSMVWHRKIEEKFGKLESRNISQIIHAKAQGMFIFAELFAKYLEDQVNRADLFKELEPNKLPVKLDHVYERILDRVCNGKSGRAWVRVQEILGWIACAKRPLHWCEIQGAVCIDLDNQCLNYDKEILDTPQGLLASFIELRTDGTVQLVHETARSFLLSKGLVKPEAVDYYLSYLSLSYLCFPQMDLQRGQEYIASELLTGSYAFYDYASACWAIHLQSALGALQKKEELDDLRETLEVFIEMHWSENHKSLQDVKRVEKVLEPLKTSTSYWKIVQSVAWSKRQNSKQGQGPNPDEALVISKLTARLRSVLENFLTPSLSQDDAQKLQRFYGKKWFKCPRINCNRYHHGFHSATDREKHLDKHTRPFLCFVVGCHIGTFGCSTEKELTKHLFDYHGIDGDESVNAEFPEPLSKQRPPRNAPKDDGKFACTLCGKMFTRQHNLNNHFRTHTGDKPFACNICHKKFTRKDQCNRHEISSHGEKPFKCQGVLEDGKAWGCEAAFGRADKLADHFRSKAGQKCIYPLMLQKFKDGGTGGADGSALFAEQSGPNAAALQAAERLLLLGYDGIGITDEDANSRNFEESLWYCGIWTTNEDAKSQHTQGLPPDGDISATSPERDGASSTLVAE
ncbi:hypothetical protein B0I35DRAFT_420512 [Stachybotrys elegans]|uniref:C2H2-type domain-containing protein n=1 Tax=Stachybotrys elegans TaxID=80388 RepID=A0A8K0T6A3_9HYPO|nr:hypothetical protein B0I35DRAFT_420512 [Stachybotrys elegans]